MNKKIYLLSAIVFTVALVVCYVKIVSHTEAINYATQAGLAFDGVDDYIEVPDRAALDLTDRFSFAATFKISSADKNRRHTLLSKGDRSKDNVNYRLLIMPDGTIKFEAGTYDGSMWVWKNLNDFGGNNIGIVYDKWQTVAVTYTGTDMTFYNLTENTTKTFPYTYVLKADNYPFTIGTRLDNPLNDQFKGQLKDVRVWNVAKSYATLKEAATEDLSGTDSSLVGYWVMDEGSTKQVPDFSASGLNGTSKNFAYAANGLWFDDKNSVTLGNFLPTSYTKEAWVYHENTSTPMSDNILSGNDHMFWIENCILKTGHHSYNIQDTTCFPQKKWTHVAVTYDSATTTLVLYRDGVEVARRADVTPSTDNYVEIGKFKTGNFFRGRISEVQVWDRARTASDILADMQGELVGNETGLVGLWRFDEFTTKTVYDLTGNGHDGTMNDFPTPTFTQTIGETTVDIIAPVSPRKPIYTVMRNGVLKASSTQRIYADTGLQKDTLYTYSLQAKTAYGESQTTTKSIRTLSLPTGMLHFDGVNTYMDVSGAVSDPTVTNTFTYEFWVKAEETQEMDPQSTSGAWGTSGQHYVIYPNHGGIATSGVAGSGISIGTNGISVYEHRDAYMPALLTYEGDFSKLTHVAVVYNNKTPSLYINGQFVKKGLTSPTTPYLSLKVGGSSYGFFKGDLKDFRVWTTARTEQEIRDNMNKELTGTETGLYLNWKLDPYTTVNAWDTSSNAKHAKGYHFAEQVTHSYGSNVTETSLTANWGPVLHATAYTLKKGSTVLYTGNGYTQSFTGLTGNTLYPYTIEASGPNGDGKVASLDIKTLNDHPLLFDGTDDYFRTSTNANLAITNALTAEAWFKIDKTGINGEQKLFSKTETGSFSMSIDKNWVRGYVNIGGNYATPIFPSSDIASNQWYHLALTYDGINAKIYLNGVLKNTQTLAGTIKTTTVDFLIGAEPTTTGQEHFFKGSIGEVRLWDRAKTQQEIQHDMYEKYTGSEVNLRGYWLLDEVTSGKLNDWTGKNTAAASFGFVTQMRMEASKVTERSLKWHWISYPTVQTYEFSRDSTILYSGSLTSYEETGLTPETSYTYTLKAKNANGESLPMTMSSKTKKEIRSIGQLANINPFLPVMLNGQKQVLATSATGAMSLYDYTSETTGWTISAKATPFVDTTNGFQLPSGSLVMKSPLKIYKASSSEENLLQNATFDYDGLKNGVGSSYWVWNPNGNNYSAAIVQIDGQNAQKFSINNRPANEVYTVSQTVMVKSNAKYVFSGYIKTDTLESSEVGVAMDWFNAEYTYLSGVSTTVTQAGNGYVHFVLKATSPATAAKVHPYVYIKSKGNDANATIYMDELCFIESENILPAATASSWVLDTANDTTLFTIPANTVNAEYTLEFPPDALELTLLPGTTRVDQTTKTSHYATTVTWTINSGP